MAPGGVTRSYGIPSTDPDPAETDPVTRPSAGGPSRHLEIETKLELDHDAELPKLAGRKTLVAVGLVTAAPAVRHELDAVYFDTAELDLLRSKLTLRHRTGGDDAGWHLKLPAVAGARTEVAVAFTDADRDPMSASVPAELADLVLGAARGRALVPVARVRNQRLVTRLLDPAGSPMVEVADDHVTSSRLLQAPGATSDSSPDKSWREVEVEVLAGTVDHLTAVVSVLRSAGARPASSASKLGRALQDEVPATPKNAKPTKAAVRKASGVRREKAAGAAVLTAVSGWRDALISIDRALREGAPGGLHDARATARRIRSALTVFAPLFEPDSTRGLRNGLRDFGAVLSHASNLEVLRSRLAAQLVDEPEVFARVAATRLAAEFERTLPIAMEEVSEHIRGDHYLSMLRDLDAFLTAPPLARRAEKAAAAELPALLGLTFHALGEIVDRALADPDDERAVHDARKGAKALRYAAEAASGALGERAAVLAGALEEVQEVLGEHQDAVTSAVWLAELAGRPDTDGISGFVFGRLHAFEQAVAHGTVDDFTDAWDRVADSEGAAGLLSG